MTKAKIEHILQDAFHPQFLEVLDEGYKHIGHAGASRGGHYKVTIVSKAFKGKSRLECHRMIYQVLLPLQSSIHALAINAK